MKFKLTTPDEIRSRTMRAVKARGNVSTELRLIAILRDARLRGWRRHLPLVGRPDFAWRKEKVAVFVDGCFWHGCPVCARRRPATNSEFWEHKISGNVRRDRRVARELRSQGWSVVRVWEHALRSPEQVARRIRKVLKSAEGAA